MPPLTKTLASDSVTSASESGSAKEVKKKLFSPKVRIVVEDVEVTDAVNATATVKERNGSTSKVSLVKQSGEWRVKSVHPGLSLANRPMGR